MLKKALYATFNKEIIIELQKTVQGIFNLELEQCKAKLEKTLSDSHALNLSTNKNYNSCNTTTTNNSCNNDSKIPRLKNTHLAPPQWDITSANSDATTNFDNGRLT